ncbi:MAG: rubredoxin [Actinobacteria bacterium]|nr:MAG: rubredoxin [Actinomycetota bacterium]
MRLYVCSDCGYTYDPRKGDPAAEVLSGTSFYDLPEDWICPECGADQAMFRPLLDAYSATA